MRPTKHPQSAIRCPLNHVLGAEANVRVLRAIFLSPIPIGTGEIARETKLQLSGILKVCDFLEDLGVIETAGRGRARQFMRRQGSMLWNVLGNLFQQERTRGDGIFDAVRSTVQRFGSTMQSAWIEGPFALGVDGPHDAIIIGAVVRDTEVELVRDQLWAQLLPIQSLHDVSIDLRVMTEADLRTATAGRIGELRDAIPLVGAPPGELGGDRAADPPGADAAPHRARRHENTDERLLRIAAAIAERMRHDPSITDSARAYVDRRLLVAHGSEALALREWKDLLQTQSTPRLRRLLVLDDARGRRLRQSLPFIGVLSDLERSRLMRD
jgi:hypothetical protein